MAAYSSVLTITEQKQRTAARLVDVTCTFGRHDKPLAEQRASGSWT